MAYNFAMFRPQALVKEIDCGAIPYAIDARKEDEVYKMVSLCSLSAIIVTC